jgi:hypothetical protein
MVLTKEAEYPRDCPFQGGQRGILGAELVVYFSSLE